MIVNEFGDCIFDEQDILDVMINDNFIDLSKLNILDKDIIEKFNRSVKLVGDQCSPLSLYSPPTCTIEEYDQNKQSCWLIPIEYQKFDIKSWLLENCNTPVEMERVKLEIKLFEQKQMIPVLCCLKYLVDFMRQEKIVWGVGRGSSVASYCLYLIGVHKINSIKYSLDIQEFFKGEIHD